MEADVAALWIAVVGIVIAGIIALAAVNSPEAKKKVLKICAPFLLVAVAFAAFGSVPKAKDDDKATVDGKATGIPATTAVPPTTEPPPTTRPVQDIEFDIEPRGGLNQAGDGDSPSYTFHTGDGYHLATVTFGLYEGARGWIDRGSCAAVVRVTDVRTSGDVLNNEDASCGLISMDLPQGSYIVEVQAYDESANARGTAKHEFFVVSP